jgi:hypothetical protein
VPTANVNSRPSPQRRTPAAILDVGASCALLKANLGQEPCHISNVSAGWIIRHHLPSTTTAQLASIPLPSPPLTAPASSTSTSPTFPPSIPFQTAAYSSFAGCKWKRVPARDCTRNLRRTHCQLGGGSAKSGERPAPSPEITSVLDSDEEREAAAKGPGVKQEHGVTIKTEPGVGHQMDGHASP